MSDPTIHEVLMRINRVTKARDDVLAELDEAFTEFPSMHSAHEGLAILEEEFLELRQEVFWGTRERQREEAIQVAAMAIRFIVDVCDRDE